MDIHQLKTFVTVAREGSVTRASELLHLSQPAVSAHIKAIEDAFELKVFERTSRGMTLTVEGQRLLAKAEVALSAHQAFVEEGARIRGRLSGKLRLGAGSTTHHAAVGRLLTTLSERHPELEVALKHGTSQEVLSGLRAGSLDAGFYNEGGHPDGDLVVHEVSSFRTYVVAAPGLVPPTDDVDWRALAAWPWIYPSASACCGRTGEELFVTHGFRPTRILSVDRESLTRSLVAGGLGVGLLHADTFEEARARGEVECVAEARSVVRVLFAHLASRAHDPLVDAASRILRESAEPQLTPGHSEAVATALRYRPKP